MAITELFTTLNKMKEAVDELPELVSAEIMKRTKARTPVITGHLRDSWEYLISSNIQFTNSADYAGFIEYGTIHISPVRMLTRSINEAPSILNEILSKKGLK